MLLTPAEIKPKSFESRRNSFFLPGVDVSHVYVRTLALGCFYSHNSTQTFLEGADHFGGPLCRDKDYPFSGITKSGRVWRKVPESDARSVIEDMSGDGWIYLVLRVEVVISLFFTGRSVCSPNIFWTVRRTMIRFCIERLVRRTWFDSMIQNLG